MHELYYNNNDSPCALCVRYATQFLCIKLVSETLRSYNVTITFNIQTTMAFQQGFCGDHLAAITVLITQRAALYGCTAMLTGIEQVTSWRVSTRNPCQTTILMCHGLIGTVNLCLYIMEECIPKRRLPSRKNLSWLNRKLVTSMKKRNLLYRRAKRSGDFTKYKSAWNKLVSDIRKAI